MGFLVQKASFDDNDNNFKRRKRVYPLELIWWYWLGLGSVLLLEVSGLIPSDTNLDGLV